MEYQNARDIRSRSFGSLMSDKILSGEGIASSFGKTISEKSKARMTGFKESFDPLSIAKTLTGGSRLAPAILGKMLGRSQEDLKYFAGDPNKKKLNNSNGGGMDKAAIDSSIEVLGLIYRLMVRMNDDEKQYRASQSGFLEEQNSEEDKRTEELVKALSVLRKKKEPKKVEPEVKEKPVKKKPAPKKKKEEKPSTKKEKKPAAEKVPPKETPKPTVEKVAPKKVAKPTAKPEVKPTAPSTPSKLSTAEKIITGVAITAGAKESLAMNISKYESGKAGYNAYNKGTIGNKMIPSDKPIDFSKMTISQVLKRGDLKPGDPDRLFAVGKYQIIPKTMRTLVEKMKLDPNKTYLDAKTQDILFEQGLVGTLRKKVDQYIKGKSNDRDGAILELAQEFASVGVPYPAGKAKRRGESYYSGVGGNKAHNSPEEVGKALDLDREKFLSNNKSSLSENNTGNKIDSFSRENKDLKESLNKDKSSTVVSSTTVNKQNNNQPQKSKDKVDDRNAYIKKAQS